MNTLIREVLAYGGLAGIVYVISFVSLAKVGLGSILTLCGAFLPFRAEGSQAGEAKLTLSRVTAAFRGSVRYGVVLAGLVLIVQAGFEGVSAVRADSVTGEKLIAAPSRPVDRLAEAPGAQEPTGDVAALRRQKADIDNRLCKLDPPNSCAHSEAAPIVPWPKTPSVPGPAGWAGLPAIAPPGRVDWLGTFNKDLEAGRTPEFNPHEFNPRVFDPRVFDPRIFRPLAVPASQ